MYILSNEEVNELYSVPRISEEDRDVVFSLNDKELEQLLVKESDHLQLYYILLLSYFKEKPVRLDLDIDAKNADFEHVKNRYFPGKDLTPIQLTANQKYKIYRKIFSVVDVVEYSAEQAEKLACFAENIAVNQCLPVSMFDELLDWLRLNKTEIPSYRKLTNLIIRVFNDEKQRVVDFIAYNLSNQTKKTFKSLLHDPSKKSIFDNIRFEGRDFSPKQIKKEASAFDELASIFQEIRPFVEALGISLGRIKYYAELFSGFSISRSKSRSEDEYNLLLTCYIYFRFRSLVDYLGDAFRHVVNVIEKEAKESAANKILTVKESMDEMMSTCADIVEFYYDKDIDDRESFNTIKKMVFSLISEFNLKQLVSYLRQGKLEKVTYFWEEIDKKRTVITKILRPIVARLEFIDAAENGVLYQQIEQLKTDIVSHNDLQSIDNRLAKTVKNYLYDRDDHLISLRAEYHLYSLIETRFNSDHWFLNNSTRYLPLEELLVDECRVDELLNNINSERIKEDPSTLLSRKMEELHRKLKLVPERVKSRENETLILDRKDGEQRWTIKRVKGEKAVNHRTFSAIPKTDISTVIYTTARDTGFFEEIRHVTGQKKTENFELKFIACAIANATRQGVYKMSDLCEFSHDTLLRFQSNYLSLENLRRANDRISDATSKLSIFKHYNYSPGYTHASIDGQKLHSERNTRRIRYSSKYFRKGMGLYADSLVANNVPINAKLYGLNVHESYNAFDLLYNNTTEIQVDAVSTDNHGVNRFNFALLDLSDWAFNPRYAKPNRVFGSMFDVVESETDENDWTLVLREPIDEKVILKGWDYVKRVVVSLHQGDISQSDFVGKLSRSSRSDKNLDALREYDRLIKAIYLLDYVNDSSFRRFIQTVLNRGEAYHQLQRTFEKVGGRGGFRGKSDAEIDMWYECSRLMANCIIYFNSVMLSYVLDSYERQGKVELIQSMARTSPVAWVHILMGGKYAFDHLKDTPDLQTMITELLAA